MPESSRNYRHLTFDDRCDIQKLLNANATMSEIARLLHRSVSSVTRLDCAQPSRRRVPGLPGFGDAPVRTRSDLPGERALQRLLEQALRELQEGALHQHL
ncbi:MAG: helix-turn-helix domain-containing protein [Coriobacteriia bacterium]